MANRPTTATDPTGAWIVTDCGAGCTSYSSSVGTALKSVAKQGYDGISIQGESFLNAEQLIRGGKMKGPGSSFTNAVAGLIDAYLWVMSQSEESRKKGEFAGEVDKIGQEELSQPGTTAYTYDTPRYYDLSKGEQGRNRNSSFTVFAFHSHPIGTSEEPSGTDYKSSGNYRDGGINPHVITVLFTGSGAIRAYTQIRYPIRLFGHKTGLYGSDNDFITLYEP